MRRNSFHSIAAALLIGAAAVSLAACSSEDNITGENSQQPAESQAPVYQVSIPATLGGGAQTRAVEFGADGSTITTKFVNTDKVYVYNVTKGAFACDATSSHNAVALTPSSISGDGQSCTLSGELSFYKKDGGSWSSVTVESTDTYALFYNMSIVNSGSPAYSSFDYEGSYSGTKPNGANATAYDFAQATGVTMTLDGSTLKPSANVTFTNLQPMFRQRLSFTQGSGGEGSTTPTISQLTISTKNGTLVSLYKPLSDTYERSEIYIDAPTIDSNGDIFLALAFNYDGSHSATGDQLILTALSDDGHVYECKKNVPTGGFVAGKYYHGTMTLAWKEQRYAKPTVSPATEPSGYVYEMYGSAVAYSISGTSKGYRFENANFTSCTVTLSSLTAQFGETAFISCQYSDGYPDMTIALSGANSITCDNATAIKYESGKVLLSGNGTLAVTVSSADYCGIEGTNYTSSSNSHATTTELDVSDALAAPGHKVTRSARSESDGKYTWTYTVAPIASKALSALTSGEIGWRIGSDGNAYEATGKLPSTATAEAIVAYIGTAQTGGTGAATCTYGLAFATADALASNCHWSDASSAVTSWASSHAVTGISSSATSGWRFPTVDDFKYMFAGCGGGAYSATLETNYTSFNSGTFTTLMPGVSGKTYWTGTDSSATDHAYECDFSNNRFDSNGIKASHSFYVRAVLAF